STAPAQQQVKPQTPAPAPSAAVTPAPQDAPIPSWLGPPGRHSPDNFLAVPYMGIPSARLVIGPEFDDGLRGIAVADLNGDGRKEVALALNNRINIYAVDGKAFRLLWSSKDQSWEKYSNILALDAADINGNGVAEIFVTSYFGDDANSFVLEFQEKEWVKIWGHVELFFRVLPNRLGEPVLYAQRGGGTSDEPFAGRVRTYVARNGDYEPETDPKLPSGTYIYNFAIGDVRNDGSKQVLQIDNEHRLRVYKGGKLKSQPPDRFGGSGVFFDFYPGVVKQTVFSDADVEFERITVHPRLLISDVDEDGKRELVTVQNTASTTQIFKHLTLYDKSKILALRWGGTGFQILWETPNLEGYITDLFFGDLGDGQGRVLMFALVRPEKLGLMGETSGLFLYRLGAGGPQPQGARTPQLGQVVK
ncbi:MAG: FG-GAP repeat domain-containing protein, partial [Candidatus Methylomirabilales bacterium]